MTNVRILWVDDEIDLLKPHILFLEQKGFEMHTASNGEDAIDMIEERAFDVVFLDENMPGLNGLETLSRVKNIRPDMPIVMITKSEEEHLMEDAIGSKISDYLIKPVNPNQILLSLKKLLDVNRLVSEKTTMNYQQEFREIAMSLAQCQDWEDWVQLYNRLVFWEVELERIQDPGLSEILQTQKIEANAQFFRFVSRNYESWIQDGDGPLMSHELLGQEVFPHLEKGKPSLLVLIDNLRLDQWKIIAPALKDYFSKASESSFCSILPTATQYARNAIFAGLMPLEIARNYPQYWKNDTDEGGKNLFEKELLFEHLKRKRIDLKTQYLKITNHQAGRKLAENPDSILNHDFTALVYNFVDMLSHSKTEMEVIKELADDDRGYRSLTQTWFDNSPLLSLLKKVSEHGVQVFITTDHGTINVKEPTKVVGDKNTNTNLRYKLGKNLSYEKKDVYEAKQPERIKLPKVNVSSAYVFAKEDLFFAYPNNYNHYVKYYKNTYQHGGISMEEMIIPVVRLNAK